MKSRLKKLMAILLVGLLSVFATYSSIISNQTVPLVYPASDSNISDYYPASFNKAIKKSRQSAVQIVSIEPNSGHLSIFSGTYFEAGGSYFVVTVLHGIAGECEVTKIIHQDQIHDCIKYITSDSMADYIIIQVEKMESRVPIKIPQDIPNNQQWKRTYSLLNKLVYTGYPNTVGPLTIDGEVSGFAGTDYLYMLSYAWQGSSGSGVFDKNGKYIGYVVAIDVGQTEHGVQILQNVVLVVPSFKIDWTKALTESE